MVEVVFDVKVKNVNIVNVCVKFKCMGKYVGYIKKCCKVIVILIEDLKEI